MKQYFINTSIIFLFFLMLLYPETVFEGAKNGLLLWFQTVLPTLLPFIIFSNLLLQTQAIYLISKITGPLFRPLFHVSAYGTFAILCGFLCGYPMGSKITANLFNLGHISKKEASYLLSFCNNASPIFIISYIVIQNLKNKTLLVPALVILFAAPVLSSFLFRLIFHYGMPAAETLASKQTRPHFVPQKSQEADNLMDFCIMDGFETITKVGGYIILFSIFLSFFQQLPIHHFAFEYFLLPSVELTNGISFLCKNNISEKICFFLCMIHASFGGWCSIAQTNCMIQKSTLSIKLYIIEKLATMLVTSFLTCIYLRFLY